MKKLVMRWTVSIMSVIFLLVFGETMTVSAAEVMSDAEVILVSGYEVSNEIITPGNEFTLTIRLHNYSGIAAPSVAQVVVSNPQGVIPEYGSISEAVIGSVGANADASVSFKYSAEAVIDSNYLDFTVHINSQNNSSSSVIRIPVGRTTDFEAENVSIPEIYGVNQQDYVSAKVTNLSAAGVSNAVIVARCDGEEIASNELGTMVVGISKTETLSVNFTEEGEYLLELVLTYTDQDGENKEYMIESTTITVSDEVDIDTPVEDSLNTDVNDEMTDTQDGIELNYVAWICICGFLVIAVCCVVLIIIYKRK